LTHPSASATEIESLSEQAARLNRGKDEPTAAESFRVGERAMTKNSANRSRNSTAKTWRLLLDEVSAMAASQRHWQFGMAD